MSDEKPLHIQVALALGYTHFDQRRDQTMGSPSESDPFSSPVPPRVWVAVSPGVTLESHKSECVYGYDGEPCSHEWPRDFQYRIPPYGEDSPEGWACTGPLIVRFRLNLWFEDDPHDQGGPRWVCTLSTIERHANSGQSPTACEAIARCVVALAAAGKLPK